MSEIPSHEHVEQHPASSGFGNTADATNAVPAKSGAAIANYAAGVTNDTTMLSHNVGATGGGQPHNNTQPVLCVNFIIALTGLYPSRN